MNRPGPVSALIQKLVVEYGCTLEGLTGAGGFRRSRETRFVKCRNAIIRTLSASGVRPQLIGRYLMLDRGSVMFHLGMTAKKPVKLADGPIRPLVNWRNGTVDLGHTINGAPVNSFDEHYREIAKLLRYARSRKQDWKIEMPDGAVYKFKASSYFRAGSQAEREWNEMLKQAESEQPNA